MAISGHSSTEIYSHSVPRMEKFSKDDYGFNVQKQF